MQKVVLKNGLTVIFKRKKGKAVVIEVMVKVGSNHESVKEKGLSHLLEHLLFEGPVKRPTISHISNEIEKIGGEFNAYTTNERTCFYVKVLKKHFATAVDVLSDIFLNSLFRKENISKEKNIVLKEIDMVHDDPKFYQWILFQKNLFKKHPCKDPTYGDKRIVKALTREAILNYFQRYYVPSNIIISLVGDVPGWRRQIEKMFVLKRGFSPAVKKINEPLSTRNTIKREKKNVVNTYVVLGFKTVPRNNRDCYALEVINGILGRGQSGRIFTEIRSKRGLAYDVGTQHAAEVSFGYFAIYATINKNKLAQVQDLILAELKKLPAVTPQELKESKDYLEGDYLLEIEDPQKVADQLLFWEQVKDTKLMDKYINNIKKVTVNDVKRAAKKYFKNYTMIVLEGK